MERKATVWEKIFAKHLWNIAHVSKILGDSLVAQLVKILPAMQVSLVWFLGQEDPLEKGYRPPTPVFLDFPCGSAGKKSTYNARDLGSIPGLGRFPWRRERLPTSVFWPGEFQGLYSPWGRKQSDITGQLSLISIIITSAPPQIIKHY